ncbi:MAG: single-stranded DNA-binding protein [Alistipes sp.]|nr:single-stranded DNA-binding protein [Alistipes sp.]
MINKVILVGNVGMDPEVRSLESGVKVARLRLATTERIFNRQTNESTDHTEWHTVTLWRGLADVADKFVRKGSQIYIEGRLRSREWDKDGVKHTAVEIVADEMKLLGRRSDTPQQGGYQGGYSQPQQGGYAQPQQSSYQGGYAQPQSGYAPQSAPAPQPMAPSIPAEDPDDMPF